MVFGFTTTYAVSVSPLKLVVSLNSVHGEVYSIHYAIKFVSGYRKWYWPEETLAGCHGSDRMRNRCPRFSSSSKSIIAHDRHGYRMWRDPKERCAHAQPEVAQYPTASALVLLSRTSASYLSFSSPFTGDCRVYRKWKIRLCQEIRTQYPTYDDPNTRSHLVVLWRIADFIRNRIWSGLSTRFTGLGHPRPQRKRFNHFERSHGRNGPKGGFTVCEKKSPQKHQRHVHRSESVSSRKTSKNHKSQCPLHGRLQKLERRIADHGASIPNASQENAIFPLSELRPYLTAIWWSIWSNTRRISWDWEPSSFPVRNRKHMSSHEKDVTSRFLSLLHQMLRE